MSTYDNLILYLKKGWCRIPLLMISMQTSSRSHKSLHIFQMKYALSSNLIHSDDYEWLYVYVIGHRTCLDIVLKHTKIFFSNLEIILPLNRFKAGPCLCRNTWHKNLQDFQDCPGTCKLCKTFYSKLDFRTPHFGIYWW